MTNKITSAYNAQQIEVLEGLAPVRRHPAMYIGGVDFKGLHHLVEEVVANSVDEAMAGHCDNIDVVLHEDGSLSVTDNGRGIPVDINQAYNLSGLTLAMTKLHAGGKFGDSGGYKTSGGLHGVGVSCVNALSSEMIVTVTRNGKYYREQYEQGNVKVPLKEIGKAKKNVSGTQVHFQPDPTIFTETTKFDFEFIAKRLRELAYLNAGLRLSIKEGDKFEEYEFEGGISEFVKHLNEARDPIHKNPIFISAVKGDLTVEMALQYTEGYTENVHSFANNIHTSEGGTHTSGFKNALTRVFNEYARKSGVLKEKEGNFSGDDTREGLTAVLSVKLPRPAFESQTKIRLTNQEAESAVSSTLMDGLKMYLEENPAIAKKIMEKALLSQRARDAARKAMDTVKRASALDVGRMPGKLADCQETDPSKSEVLIVEGDSAGGSAKQGRDRRFQAILPLRGKPLNVEKARIDKALDNEEIRAMITAIGTGIHGITSDGGGKTGRVSKSKLSEDDDDEANDLFDISKLRYHRIIIMTDSDVDGSHIAILLLTFFFRYLRPLITNGHVYLARPPLYGVITGKKTVYARDEKERDAIVKGLGRSKYRIQRFKGLGEMNPEQLATTTMDIATRTLARVTITDAEAADEMFTVLMGDKVPPRRAVIEKYAASVRNLDI